MGVFFVASVDKLLKKADAYRSTINNARPLDEIELKSLHDYFRVGLTYSSNALEGNTLDLTETKIILEDGLTVSGKPMRDVLEALGHAKAYDYMMDAAKAQPFIVSEELIKKLHYLFFVGQDPENAGVYRKVKVFISGTDYVPPAPADVPGRMTAFVAEMNGKRDKLHPIELAALLHKGLVDIHPFIDGNGRTARLLMNLALVNAGYGIAVIYPTVRRDYITSLRMPGDKAFTEFCANAVLESQRDYCRMLGIPLRI